MHLDASTPAWILLLTGIVMTAMGLAVLADRGPRRYASKKARRRSGLGVIMIAASMLINGGFGVAHAPAEVAVASSTLALILAIAGGAALIRKADRPTEPPRSNEPPTGQ